ncbi:MAG: DUF4262 domain-containing protein [Jatrophihabitans sp.]
MARTVLGFDEWGDGMDDEEEDPILVRQWLDQEDAWMRDTVRRVGWAIQYVMGEEREPSFAYTVGLFGFDHPEIVVFGLSAGSSEWLLNRLGALVKSGAPMGDGDEVTIGAAGFPVSLFTLPNPESVLFAANSFYQRPPGDPVPALQAVYPDDNGRYPWEPGYALKPYLQPMPGAHSA